MWFTPQVQSIIPLPFIQFDPGYPEDPGDPGDGKGSDAMTTTKPMRNPEILEILEM